MQCQTCACSSGVGALSGQWINRNISTSFVPQKLPATTPHQLPTLQYITSTSHKRPSKVQIREGCPNYSVLSHILSHKLLPPHQLPGTMKRIESEKVCPTGYPPPPSITNFPTHLTRYHLKVQYALSVYKTEILWRVCTKGLWRKGLPATRVKCMLKSTDGGLLIGQKASVKVYW